ncbi:hypothetical protein [Guptibacillus hwajinpoensis]|uniref:hypothetical protein n=1 Tax=Guptibacillus hwajinpoensis TaxID=208199 RepID=UPI00384CD39F
MISMNQLFFSDNFFSAGRTDIYNSDHETVGALNLRSAFSSKVEIEDVNGDVTMEGAFTFFANKWIVRRKNGDELGYVKMSFTFLSKKFHYFKDGKKFTITSPAFSKEYSITDDSNHEVATFQRTNSYFESANYELKNMSSNLLAEELISIIMGVNAFQKNVSAAGAAT